MKTKKRLLTAAALTLAAVALVVATVFTTVAYLTASSAVSNTFTVGNVYVAMYESKVDADGKKLAAYLNGAKKDSDGNNYHLLPGTTYDKDPTVYIDANSDKSYIFVKLRNNISPIEYGNFVHSDSTTPINTPDPAKPTIADQMAAYGWKFYIATPTGDVYVYVGNTANAKDGVMNGNKITDTATLAQIKDKTVVPTPSAVGSTNTEEVYNLFDTFTIDEHADVSIYGGAKVTLTAFAIQVSGFTDDASTPNKNEALDAAWAAIVETYPYENGAAAENP